MAVVNNILHLYMAGVGFGSRSRHPALLCAAWLAMRLLEKRVRGRLTTLFWRSHYAHDFCHLMPYCRRTACNTAITCEEDPERVVAQVFGSNFHQKASDHHTDLLTRAWERFVVAKDFKAIWNDLRPVPHRYDNIHPLLFCSCCLCGQHNIFTLVDLLFLAQSSSSVAPASHHLGFICSPPGQSSRPVCICVCGKHSDPIDEVVPMDFESQNAIVQTLRDELVKDQIAKLDKSPVVEDDAPLRDSASLFLALSGMSADRNTNTTAKVLLNLTLMRTIRRPATITAYNAIAKYLSKCLLAVGSIVSPPPSSSSSSSCDVAPLPDKWARLLATLVQEHVAPSSSVADVLLRKIEEELTRSAGRCKSDKPRRTLLSLLTVINTVRAGGMDQIRENLLALGQFRDDFYTVVEDVTGEHIQQKRKRKENLSAQRGGKRRRDDDDDDGDEGDDEVSEVEDDDSDSR